MRSLRFLSGIAVLCSLFACGSTETVTIPDGEGLISCDQTPPEGAELTARPELKVGDTFSYRKGGKVTIELRVVHKDDASYALAEATSGLVRHYNLDFAQLGESLGKEPAMQSRLAPADDRFTWPLWVGKRWSSNFTHQGAGGNPLPITAEYHCDAKETLEVGMRKFDCYRIWRHANLGDGTKYLEQVSISWYAPEVGRIVQRLDDGLLTQLTAYHRQ